MINKETIRNLIHIEKGIKGNRKDFYNQKRNLTCKTNRKKERHFYFMTKKERQTNKEKVLFNSNNIFIKDRKGSVQEQQIKLKKQKVLSNSKTFLFLLQESKDA